MKELLRSTFAAATIAAAASLGSEIADSHSGESFDHEYNRIEVQNQDTLSKNELKNDLEKVGWTLIGGTWILGVGLLGYRMSDGSKDREKQLWLYVLPSVNTIGTSILVASKWL